MVVEDGEFGLGCDHGVGLEHSNGLRVLVLMIFLELDISDSQVTEEIFHNDLRAVLLRDFLFVDQVA